MFIVFFRAIILYLVIVVSMRLMGKRQLGELQPSELVVTVLLSNIATLPVENVNIPMIMGIKGISGMSPWVLSDFRSPRRNLDGVQDGFNRKGLTDEFGQEKRAFGVLRDFYAK